MFSWDAACPGYLDQPFLKTDTQQENSQAYLRRTGRSCLPVTLGVLQIIRGPSVLSRLFIEYSTFFLYSILFEIIKRLDLHHRI